MQCETLDSSRRHVETEYGVQMSIFPTDVHESYETFAVLAAGERMAFARRAMMESSACAVCTATLRPID